MIPASLQPPTPHSFYKSVWLKIVAAIYNGAKHYSNRNSAIHAYALSRGVRRKFSWGGFGSGSYGGHLYLVCAVCDVTIWRHVPNQRFGEVCWHNNAYFSTRAPLISCVIALNVNYQRSKLGYRRKINSTLRHSSSQLQKYQAAH